MTSICIIIVTVPYSPVGGGDPIMARVQAYTLTQPQQRDLITELERLFASCRSGDELRQLLRNLLSRDEQVMLARRLRIARQLLDGRTHAQITADLGVGADTVDRVRQWLERNRTLYHLLVERVRRQAARQRRQEARRNTPRFSWPDFRKRYPMQFWPLELVAEVEELIQSHRNRRRRLGKSLGP